MILAPSVVRLTVLVGLAVSIFNASVSFAETTLVQVGNPVFKPVGSLLAMADIGIHNNTHTVFLHNIAEHRFETFNEHHIPVRHTNHRLFAYPRTDNPHDGSHAIEVREALARQGHVNTDVILTEDFAAPNTLLRSFVLVPTEDAPMGASADSANGPILPNDIFPIEHSLTASGPWWRANCECSPYAMYGLNENIQRLRDIQGEIHNVDFSGLSLNHWPIIEYFANHIGDDLSQYPGEYSRLTTLRDQNGNGWDVTDTFRVVAEPTNLFGDLSYNGELDLHDLNILTQNVVVAPEGRPSDAFLRLDMNGDDLVDASDVHHWVTELKQTWIGDADLDGEFNSGDLVNVFGIGKFETDHLARWSEGDWNGDERFGSDDLVVAFGTGGYEAGERAAVAAVPEPSGWVLLTLGLIGMRCARRKR